MAGSQSIGTLAAIISANAQQLVDELNRTQGTIDQVAAKTGSSFDKMSGSLARAGLQVVAGAHLFSLLHQEIKEVIKNVEDIPGVSPETIASVEQMRHNLNLASNELKAGLAYVLGHVQDLMSKVGQGAANLVNVLNGLPKEAYTPKPLTPDELEKDRDPHFDKKLTAAKKQLEDAQLKYYEVGESKAQTLINLNTAYHDKLGEINRDTMDSIEITKIQTEAQKIQNTIKQKTYDLNKEIADLGTRDAAVVAARYNIFEDKQERLNDLLSQRATMQKEEARLAMAVGDIQAGVGDRMIALKKQEIALDEKITVAMNKAAQESKQIGNALADSLESATFSGKKLDQVLKDLLNDLLKVLYHNGITVPLGNALGSSLNSAGGFSGIMSGIGHLLGFASGGRPPTGVPSIVGENGPELFVPDSAGTVVPNRAMGAGGRSVNYIDARGADRTGLAKLESMIRALDGSIEYRSVASVLKYKRGAATSSF